MHTNNKLKARIFSNKKSFDIYNNRWNMKKNMNSSNPLKKMYIEISKLSHQQQKHSDHYDFIIYNYNYTIQIHNTHIHKEKETILYLKNMNWNCIMLYSTIIIIIIIVYNDYWPSHTHTHKKNKVHNKGIICLWSVDICMYGRHDNNRF